MKSKNMNYIFNVEYFEDIELEIKEKESSAKNDKEDLKEKAKKEINRRNRKIIQFSFQDMEMLKECEDLEGYHKFELYTLYPGLLVGIGNPHELAVDGALKQGFSFDYVTGVPYIPGSSLKGMLRSYFPNETRAVTVNEEYRNLISEILGKKDVDIFALKKEMFEKDDVFFGAFPVIPKGEKQSLLEMDFITPHKEKFKNPIPISMIKVKPSVKFVFSFLFSDSNIKGVTITAKEKVNLCKELIVLMGIGAKTNTGYGRFAASKPNANIEMYTVSMGSVQKMRMDTIDHKKHIKDKVEVHKCQTPGCENDVKFNTKINKYNRYCTKCYLEKTK